MSGNLFDELKKNDLSKKRDKLKFVTAVVLTNLLVGLATYSLCGQGVETKPHPKVVHIIHPNHKMIVAPLTLLTEFDSDMAEIPVTLMDRNKKILVQRAYLHEETKGRFKIEIPEEDVLKLSADLDSPMIAIPGLNKELPKLAAKKRVSKYEITL